MNKSYDVYVSEIIKDGRKPTKKEVIHLGNMIISEKWFNFKQLFKRKNKKEVKK